MASLTFLDLDLVCGGSPSFRGLIHCRGGGLVDDAEPLGGPEGSQGGGLTGPLALPDSLKGSRAAGVGRRLFRERDASSSEGAAWEELYVYVPRFGDGDEAKLGGHDERAPEGIVGAGHISGDGKEMLGLRGSPSVSIRRR